MATQLQIRRGTSAQIAAFTGAEGEIVVNTTNDSVHVNDGSTAGGFEMARADLNNVSDTSLNAALTGNTVSALTVTALTTAGVTTTGDISFGDNDKAIFGAGSDLQIYHDGSDSYIDENGTGTLKIKGTNLALLSSTNEFYAFGSADGAFSIYHDNSAKLATTSTGIDVTGSVTADGLTVDKSGGNIAASFINSDSNNSYIQFQNSTTGTTTYTDGSLVGIDSDESLTIWQLESNHIKFGTSATERMRIDASGNLLVGKTTTAFGTVGIRLEGPNGKIEATRSNNIVMDLNRLSGDGAIVNFSKDSSTVGSIGTVGGLLGVGSGVSNLQFESSSTAISPASTTSGGASDGALGLGKANRRFKDLYLSGEAKVTSTGVDGVYAPILRGVYSGNSNETNTIETTVSSSAAGSGFKFNVSNGGGSSGQTEGLRITRDGLYAPVGIKLGSYSSANLLDDYEEGTWTPSWTGLGNGSASGTYTKIGRLVHVTALFTAGSTTSIGSKLEASNLPFAAQFLTYSGARYENYQSNSYIGATRVTGSQIRGYIINVAGATSTESIVSATNPFTWGVNDYAQLTATYYVA